MKELQFLELQEVELAEIINYSKLENSPSITILDELNSGAFNQIVIWADELKLIFFIIKGTRKIAFIGKSIIAQKIAKILQVKSQTMYYCDLKPRKIFGKIYVPNKQSNYVVKAYNERGQEIKPFIDTNIENVSCDMLLNYNFRDYKYAMKIRGAGNNKVESLQALGKKRKDFLKNGKI